MQPGNNPIEAYKAARHGNPLTILEDVPQIIATTAGLGDGDWDKLAPSDKEMLKWLGVFFRKPTPGKFMMRIRMPNGFATSAQLAAIADLSERLGDNTVDVTTRQQLELRGFTLAGLPEIWERLRDLDLRSLQTGQDNVRNLNGCALAGLAPHELLDASGIIFELDRIIVGKEGNPEYANLPRKFNVVVTGCRENCMHAETQDVALVPATKAGRSGFHVLAGGKMGSGGFTIAKNLGWFVPPERAVETVLAIVQLFRDEGPREARTKIRLAFLIENWGLGVFKKKIQERLTWEPEGRGEDARLKRHNDHLGVQDQGGKGDLCSVGLVIPVGRTRPAGLRELARLADEYGSGEIRLTTAQNAILVNVARNRVEKLLAEPLLKDWPAEASRFQRGLVSCVGTEYCNLALIDTKNRSLEVSRQLDQMLGGLTAGGDAPTIHWSGCPAGCGNHAVADIGLRGTKVNVNGESKDAVAIYVGGRSGPNSRAAQQIMDLVPCDDVLPDVLATVIRHLDLFKKVERDPDAKARVLMVPDDQSFPSEGSCTE
jgi:ferredoxin-nitrite reductase